ncbi:MAG: M23 family metallopeptidase, partial [Alphaproteobacteria bacterium]
MRALLRALLILLPGLAMAEPVMLSGDFTQGGLVIGTTAPGSTARFDGNDLAITEDGLFLIGFGRDAAKTGKLTVSGPTGDVETRILDIA